MPQTLDREPVSREPGVEIPSVPHRVRPAVLGRAFAGARAMLLLAGLATLAGSCDKSGTGFNIPKTRDLKPGGVYVAYNLGCEQGCDQIQKGDLIQTFDGKAVATAADLATLPDGGVHKLELLTRGTFEPKTVDVKATPKNNLPPLKDVPPFWLVGAEALNQAPDWARGRMFGHASPMVMLVSADGGILDGRQLFGQKRLMVYWDWGDREEEVAAVEFMQVLQKAQADLESRNVDVMFVHVRFPSGRKAPMNDTDLRAWQNKWTIEEGGKKLRPLDLYRFPNETEFNEARELGLENAFTVIENLSRSPSIVLLDERGIVRWHSQGLVDPFAIGSEVRDPEQATIISAITFALEKL